MGTKTKNAAIVALARKGGLASSRALSPTQRTLRARRAALIRYGRLQPDKRQWLVFDPAADNPPVILFSAAKQREAEHWAASHCPNAFITSLATRFTQRASISIGEVERKYEPDTARQVQALKTLAEAVKGNQ